MRMMMRMRVDTCTQSSRGMCPRVCKSNEACTHPVYTVSASPVPYRGGIGVILRGSVLSGDGSDGRGEEGDEGYGGGGLHGGVLECCCSVKECEMGCRVLLLSTMLLLLVTCPCSGMDTG